LEPSNDNTVLTKVGWDEGLVADDPGVDELLFEETGVFVDEAGVVVDEAGVLVDETGVLVDVWTGVGVEVATALGVWGGRVTVPCGVPGVPGVA
jgi:hypothetical protein